MSITAKSLQENHVPSNHVSKHKKKTTLQHRTKNIKLHQKVYQRVNSLFASCFQQIP
jgi:hypothetical protein